jgi:hypothetical protein
MEKITSFREMDDTFMTVADFLREELGSNRCGDLVHQLKKISTAVHVRAEEIKTRETYDHSTLYFG